MATVRGPCYQSIRRMIEENMPYNNAERQRENQREHARLRRYVDPQTPNMTLAAVAFRLEKASEGAGRKRIQLPDVLEQIAGELAAQAWTPRDVLATFAVDKLEPSLDDLLGARGDSARHPRARRPQALTQAEPNVEQLALSSRVLDLAWRRHGLNDPTVEVDDELLRMLSAAQWGRGRPLVDSPLRYDAPQTRNFKNARACPICYPLVPLFSASDRSVRD